MQFFVAVTASGLTDVWKSFAARYRLPSLSQVTHGTVFTPRFSAVWLKLVETFMTQACSLVKVSYNFVLALQRRNVI